MKKFLLVLVVVLTTGLSVGAQAPADFDETSVLVEVSEGFGSGVAVRNTDTEFVWTAAHVVEGHQKVRTVIDPMTGLPRVEVTFTDVTLVREIRKDGRLVGVNKRYAEVIRYSDLETGYDLALLRSRLPSCSKGAVFAMGSPAAGQAVYAVGSPMGPTGYNSYIPGTVAAIGRPATGLFSTPLSQTLEMDQYNLNITGGSSGGPVFDLKSRQILGLTTQGNARQNTIAFVVPTRVIRKFAKESDCEWAVDPHTPLPAGDGYKKACPRMTPLPLPPEWRPGPTAPTIKK